MNFVYEMTISYTKFVYEFRLRAISYPRRRNSYIRTGFEMKFVYTKWLLRRNFVYEMVNFVYEIGLRRISSIRNENSYDEMGGDEFRLPATRIRIAGRRTSHRIGADGSAPVARSCNSAMFYKRNGRFSYRCHLTRRQQIR